MLIIIISATADVDFFDGNNTDSFFLTITVVVDSFVAITFLALIAKDLGKLDHFLVILLSATFSLIFYNLPLKAYVIVSAAAGIILAYIINKKFKKKLK